MLQRGSQSGQGIPYDAIDQRSQVTHHSTAKAGAKRRVAAYLRRSTHLDYRLRHGTDRQNQFCAGLDYRRHFDAFRQLGNSIGRGVDLRSLSHEVNPCKMLPPISLFAAAVSRLRLAFSVSGLRWRALTSGFALACAILPNSPYFLVRHWRRYFNAMTIVARYLTMHPRRRDYHLPL